MEAAMKTEIRTLGMRLFTVILFIGCFYKDVYAQHPRLLFTASEIPAIRDKWNNQSAFFPFSDFKEALLPKNWPAPNAEEKISYQMPAFYLDGILVWFAAHPNHIGFYPRASAITKFKRELSRYKNAKGSVQFPLDEPLPVELIKRMVRFRVEENVKKGKKKVP
jgi:uncharacterized protein YdhG (YjbR/CyaY superfamily)